jgi:hypothetical protein
MIKMKKKRNSKGSPLLVQGVLLVIVLLIFYMIFCGMVGSKKFYHNTSINGINVSSMTVAEAAEAVKSDFEKEYNNATVDVKLDDSTYCVRIDEALNMDVTEAVKKTNASKHKFFSRGVNYIKALFSNQEYHLAPELSNKDALYAAIEATDLMSYEAADDNSYELTDTSLIVTKGRGGYVIDTDALVELLVETVSAGDLTQSVECPLKYSDVDLQVIYDEIYTEPQDASLDADNNYSVKASVDGISFDIDKAQSLMDSAEDGEQVTIDLVFTSPEISTAELEACLFRDLLGSCSTNVSGTDGRKANVAKAAENCNGTILLPGEQFSFNNVVGQRTTENGFYPAPSYVQGESVDEVGGGICQVSSTLYDACLFANLEINERHCHPYPSSYIGTGLDATVSWGGPDYIFTNNTDYPIKVVASYGDSVVYCSIYGTKVEDFTVELSAETVATYEYETEYEDDDTLEEGEEEVSVTGKNGLKVQSYRTVYDGSGNLISSEPESVSVYDTRNEVILRGTKEKATEEETEAATEEPKDKKDKTDKKKEETTEATDKKSDKKSDKATTEEVKEESEEEKTVEEESDDSSDGDEAKNDGSDANT